MKTRTSFKLTSLSLPPLVVIAALAGAITPLAFAPFNAWPLQITTLALVFWLATAQNSVRRSAVIGWAYGFGWLACGVHWLYISMHRYGGMPSWMAALAVALLALYLGLFTAVALGATTWVRQRWKFASWQVLLLLAPALWTLGEWARGWIFTGFPWLSAGYAHSVGPLAGFAPVVGVYGLALIAAIVAGCIVLLPSNKWPVGLALVLLVGGAALRTIEWTSPVGKPLAVRLLQGNVPQDMKFAPQQIEATLRLYHEMISAAPADLIATPETAIPLLSSQVPPDFFDGIAAYARRSGSHVVLGIPVNDKPGRYANGIIGMAPNGAGYRYDKHHLVPFGEFIPWGFRWFVNMMHIPLGDFSKGDMLQRPFAIAGQQVLPNICYEDLFGEEIAAQLRADGPQATMLLNVSNIAWFGDSIALPQHLQISQMRSLETGRPMLRATNTGVTAVIDSQGRVQAQLPPFQRQTLAASVQGYQGLTPYTRLGNLPVVAIAFLMLACAWLTRLKGTEQSSS